MPPTTGGGSLVGAEGRRDLKCRIAFHGEYGVEAQILRNGDLAMARTFVLRDLAVGWAKNERDRLEGDDPFA